MSPSISKLKKNLINTRLIFSAALLIVLFILFKSIFIIAFLIFIGALSLQYQRIMSYFGFELVYFSTIVATKSYGPLTGALVGCSA